MERGVEDSQRSEQTFGERLEVLCEYYMMLGVSYDEFWNGDYCRLKFYEKDFFNRQKMRDGEMWRQGLYFYRALGAALSALTGDNNASYPQQPFSLETSEEEKTPEELQLDIYAQLKATIGEN